MSTVRSALLSHLLCSLTLMPNAARADEPQAVHRINCGGGPSAAPYGPTFVQDVPYGANAAGFEGGDIEFLPFLIGGALNPYTTFDFGLLQTTFREQWQAYRFDVPDGDYIVRMHFAELQTHGPGIRTFDIAIEDQPTHIDLDLFEQFGLAYASEFVTTTTVADGRLDITAGGDDAAIINAVEVWTLPQDLETPSDITGLTALSSYGKIVLTWEPALAPTIEAYDVYRSTSSEGPFSLVGSSWAAPQRFVDSDVVPNQTMYYQVAAVDVLGQSSDLSTVVSAAALDHADTTLEIYELTISPANFKLLNEMFQEQPKEEVPGVLTHAGQTYSVEVRYRGNSTLTAYKKSWKIKFPPSQPFQGRRELNLKAYPFDATMLREPIAFESYHAARHEAPTLQPIHLIVNGEFRGVMRSVEQVDEQYLKAHNRNDNSTIFQADGSLCDMAVLPNVEAYEECYPISANAKADSYDSLDALFQSLASATATTGLADIADQVDLDNYLNYLATTIWTAHGDSTPHNYFLMQDHDLERWEWIAWDADEAMKITQLPLTHGTTLSPQPSIVNQFRDWVFSVDALRWRLLEKLKTLMSGPLDPAAVDTSIQDAFNTIEEDAYADTFKLGWEGTVAISAAVTTLNDFVQQRTSFLNSELAIQPSLTPPTSVWINELMANNNSTITDEQGQFEDWIELYNASDTAIDVGGMYLTDDIGDLTQWQIPSSTVISAKGHLLIWADKDEEDGPLHANFKFSSEGEEVGLVAADGTTLLDFYHFKRQLGDVSEGRSADGAAMFAAMPTPTPNAANTTAGNLPPVIAWVEQTPIVPTPDDITSVTSQVTDSDGIQLTTLSYRVDGGAFVVLNMQALGGQRFEAQIPAQPQGSVVEYFFTADDTLGASTLLPSDAPEDVFSYVVSDSLNSMIVISEFLADNETIAQDETGAFEDYIELYNRSASPVDVSGMHLTDDLSDPSQWQIPEGTIIAAQSHLLIWADDDPLDGPLHANFKLSKGGEDVGLYDVDGLTLLHGISFGPQQEDVATGLLPEDDDLWVSLLEPSPGSSNTPTAGSTIAYAAANFDGSTLVDLAVGGNVQLGQVMSLDIQGASPDAIVFVLYGVQTTEQTIGLPGTLLLNPLPTLIHTVVADESGNAQIVLPIPDIAKLTGITFYAQALTISEGLSNGIAATIGGD